VWVCLCRHTYMSNALVVDSDLRSITPQWVELLAKLILERDLDFIAPY
jgi:hypothetical protein